MAARDRNCPVPISVIPDGSGMAPDITAVSEGSRNPFDQPFLTSLPLRQRLRRPGIVKPHAFQLCVIEFDPCRETVVTFGVDEP